MTAPRAGVAESVDASVSNTDGRKPVWVRAPPPAPARVAPGMRSHRHGTLRQDRDPPWWRLGLMVLTLPLAACNKGDGGGGGY